MLHWRFAGGLLFEYSCNQTSNLNQNLTTRAEGFRANNTYYIYFHRFVYLSFIYLSIDCFDLVCALALSS